MEANEVQSVLANNFQKLTLEERKEGLFIALPLRMSVIIFLYVASIKPHDFQHQTFYIM